MPYYRRERPEAPVPPGAASDCVAHHVVPETEATGDVVERAKTILQEEAPRSFPADAPLLAPTSVAPTRLVGEANAASEAFDRLATIPTNADPALGPVASPLSVLTDVARQASGALLTSLSLLKAAAAVAPGASAMIPLKLVNDDTHAIRNVALRATPLVNGSGGVIPPQAVRLPAGPISLPPGAARDLDLAVAVPNGSPPGLYTGLLQSTTPDDFASVLAVLVEQATQEE